jgi:FHA domain
MTSICPAGHQSSADDYCDVCGLPIDADASQPVAPSSGPAPSAPTSPAPSGGAGPGVQICPSCSTENVAEALFCEACGYDFTTGTLPRAQSAPPAPTPDAPSPDVTKPAFTFVAEVWIDPAWYGVQQSPDPLPSPGLPEIVPLTKTSIMVGRVSKSRNIHPDIDCETDSGASRRQSQLTTDGTRWWVEDLDSANGTFVGQASDPLPMDPIPVSTKHELRPGDRVYVGAWTRIVIRPATDDELTSLA